MKCSSPAAQRNKRPICEVLQRCLPEQGTVLEVASGGGEHVVHFAERFPRLQWQPSDTNADALASIRAWCAAAKLPNIAKPLALDVRSIPWPVQHADAVVNINMIHISAWECCQALFAGAAAILPVEGLLYLYGPFSIDGRHTSPSNADFHASLRARDPSWGVRDLREVAKLAAEHGFDAPKIVQMPANNLSVVFIRRSAAS